MGGSLLLATALIYTPGQAPQYILDMGVGYGVVSSDRGVSLIEEGAGQTHIFQPGAEPTTIYNLDTSTPSVQPVFPLNGIDVE